MTGKYLKTIFSDPDHMTMFQVTDKSKYLIECSHLILFLNTTVILTSPVLVCFFECLSGFGTFLYIYPLIVDFQSQALGNNW
jgi:hypothetical protein